MGMTTSVAELLVFHARCCGVRPVLHPLLLKLLFRAAQQTCSTVLLPVIPLQGQRSQGALQQGFSLAPQGWAHASPRPWVQALGCWVMCEDVPAAEQASIVSSSKRTRLPLWRHWFLFPTGSLLDTLIHFPSGKMIWRHHQTEWMIEFRYIPLKCK